MCTLERLTLKHLLARSVEHYAGNLALSYVDGEPMTYAELGRRVADVTKLLREQGIRPGDKVAILSENRPAWGVAYFAITSMGAVAVPILTEFHENEVHEILSHSGAKAIFVSLRMARKTEKNPCESVRATISIEDFSLIGEPPAQAASTAEPLAEVQEEDLAAIIYTSGTTGQSKGVMLTHKNIVSNVETCTKMQPVNERDRFISILPLAHTLECTVSFALAIRQGASSYYLKKPPTASVLLPALRKIRPTIMLTVPLIIEKIYRLRVYPQLRRTAVSRALMKFPPTRKLLHRIAGKKLMESFGGEVVFFGIGGAAVAADVEFFLREAHFPYAIGYGLTETSPLVAGATPNITRFRSTGPAAPGVNVKILDPNPETGEGEIVVKGPNVMKGYYKDPERTKEVFTEDGWFKTGDLGAMDADGHIFVRGRSKTMLLGPSGENIYPEEIESVINRFDFVAESLVLQREGKLIARVHLDYDEVKKQFADLQLNAVQLHEKVSEYILELRKNVNQQLNAFSRILEMIEQEEPFEKTPTLKIKRYLYS